MKRPVLENPPLNPEIREQLNGDERAVVLDQPAQLIAKTAGTEPEQEDHGHE